jgi:hypothetical protein
MGDARTQRVLTPSLAQLPDSLAPERFVAALERAAEAWSSDCGVRVVIGPALSRAAAREDATNLVVFRQGAWCHNGRCARDSTFPLRALAMTTTYPEAARGRAVREADVELQAAQVEDGLFRPSWWSGASLSLEVVLAHEIGHVLGLSDRCTDERGRPARDAHVRCAPEQRASVMFAPARLAAPTALDRQALCELYPRPTRTPRAARAEPDAAPSVLASMGPDWVVWLMIVWLFGRALWQRSTKRARWPALARKR